MNKSGDCTHSFSWLPRDCEAVEVKASIGGNSEHEREAAKGEGIGVLEDNDPLFSLLEPLLSGAAHMEQGVDVAVSVGLGLNLEFACDHAEPRLVIDHSGYFFLVEDSDLLLLQPKVLVLFKQGHSFGVCVLGGHDGKWDELPLGELALEGEDVVAIVVQEALASQQLRWQRHLDARVPQSLAQTASN